MERSGHVQVQDIRMYYECHGTGTPVLLIQGLAAHHEVLAFDNRGAGRTDKPDSPYTIPLMATDAYGLLRALERGPTAVIGLSLGGRIALELTLQHPEVVTRLVLVSTGATVQRSWRRTFFPRLSGLLARGRYPQPRYALQHQLDASTNYDCTDRLENIAVPTLILHGKRDRMHPYALAQEMYRRIRGSRLIVFRGGHIFFLFRQQPFLEVVTAFLDA